MRRYVEPIAMNSSDEEEDEDELSTNIWYLL